LQKNHHLFNLSIH